MTPSAASMHWSSALVPLMLDLIRADVRRKQEWFLSEKSWFTRNIRVFLEPGTIAAIVYRFGSWTLSLPMLFRLICAPFYVAAKAFVVLGFGIYIPAKAKIGPGLTIHNFSGIFLCETTIGENCIVFQGVTVGFLRERPNPPQLGDNVFLAAGAKVLGDITIGDNVVVGANSVVLTNVPARSTVMGVPARVVAKNTDWVTERLEGRGANY